MAVNFVTSDSFSIINAEIEQNEDGQYSLTHARELAKETKSVFNVEEYLDEDTDYNDMLEATRKKSARNDHSNFDSVDLPMSSQQSSNKRQSNIQFDPVSEILSHSQEVVTEQKISVHVSLHDASSKQEIKTNSFEMNKDDFDTHDILNQLNIPDGYQPDFENVTVNERGYLSSEDIVIINVPCHSNLRREVKKTFIRRLIPVDKNDKVIAKTLEQSIEMKGENDGSNNINWHDEHYAFPSINNLPSVDGMLPRRPFIESLEIDSNSDTVITDYIIYDDLMIETNESQSMRFKVINGETGEIEQEDSHSFTFKRIKNSRTAETFPFKSIDNSPMSLAQNDLNIKGIQQAYYQEDCLMVIKGERIEDDTVLSNRTDSILSLLSEAHDEIPGLTSRSPYSHMQSESSMNDDERFAKRFLSHINNIRNKLSLSVITYSAENETLYRELEGKTPSLFKLPPEAIADREFAKSIRELLKSSSDKEFNQHYLGQLLAENLVQSLSLHLNATSEKSSNNLVYYYKVIINQ